MNQQPPTLDDSAACVDGSGTQARHADVFFSLDVTGRFLAIHAAGAPLFAQAVHELIGRCAWEVFPADFAAELHEQCRQAIATQSPIEFQSSHALSNRWWKVHVYPERESLALFLRALPPRSAQESAPRESASVLPSLLAAVFDAVLLIQDGRIIEVNVPCAALFRSTPEQLRNRPLLEIIAPEDRDGMASHLAVAAAVPSEYRACRQDGTMFEVEVQITTCISEGRNLQLVALRDTTIDKASGLMATNHLAQLDYLSKTALTFLGNMPFDGLYHYIGTEVLSLAHSAIVFVMTYDAGRNASVVKSVHGADEQLATLERILGHSPVGSAYQLSEIVPAFLAEHEGLSKLSDELDTFCTNLSPEMCQLVKDKLDIKAFHLFPLIIEKKLLGSVIIAMIGQVTPQNPYLITAFMNQASIALQRYRAEAELECEQAYLATAIDMLPLPLSFITPDGQVQRRNIAMQTFLDKFGVRRELDWQYLDPLTHVPIPSAQIPMYRALRREVTNGKEMVLATDSVQRLPAIIYAAPICLDGKVVATVNAVQDISVLKEADQAKDEFLAVLSHELRTPLTCIVGWSELIHMADDPARFRQSMEVINRNALRLNELVTELLDMSRIIHRKLAIFPARLDLRELLRQATENIQVEAQRQRLSLVIAAQEATPLYIYADPLRLQQCLGNLLQNSLKFTPSGGAITVSSAQDGGCGVLKISDTGRGIAPDMLDAVFRPFTQLHRDLTAGGLGLGLALVRGIITLHHGEISVSSPGEGLGCTFTIRLPLMAETP